MHMSKISLFCLSLALTFHVQATFQLQNPCVVARQLHQKHKYQDQSQDAVCKICSLAEKLLKKSTPKYLEVHTPLNVEGTFYRLPHQNALLYCPPMKEKFMLGEGAFKKVYKGIFFNESGAEVVAIGIGGRSLASEGRCMQSIPFQDHVNMFRCSFALPHGKQMLVSRYYNVGSLRASRKLKIFLPFKEKLIVAQDTVAALITMHEKGIVHRDIHDGNIMLNRKPDGTISAGLIDFGRSLSHSMQCKDKPQGSPHRNPPEVLLKAFSHISQKKADIFAMGCTLYRLFFGKLFPSAQIYDCRIVKSMNLGQRYAMYKKVEEMYREEWRQLEHSGKISPKLKALKENILKMLHPEAEKRIELKKIAKAIENSIN